MGKPFDIQPAKYDVPVIGHIDAFKPVSDDKLLAVYKLRRGVFPWIKTNGNTYKFLKTQKLLVGDIAKMVHNAQTKEEVEMLLKLTKSRTVKRISEVKLNALEGQK